MLSLVGRCAVIRMGCLAIACLAGCGARTEPLVGDPNEELQPGHYWTGPGSGSGQECQLCNTQIQECSSCAVQGTESTWVCELGKGPPSSGCSNLKESYKNLEGWQFTCFYCF
jgi:hypothetical protein